MKRFLLLLVSVFFIAGAYGCSGLGTGAGFQGGTEAGNPPTDGGFIGGTEAGNPPTGETTGGPGGDNDHPREGEDTCDLPDTPEKEGKFPCPTIDGHKIDMLTSEQMGLLHEAQEQQEEEQAKNGSVEYLNKDAYRKLGGTLGEFGHAETIDEAETKPVLMFPPNTGALDNVLKNLK